MEARLVACICGLMLAAFGCGGAESGTGGNAGAAGGAGGTAGNGGASGVSGSAGAGGMGGAAGSAGSGGVSASISCRPKVRLDDFDMMNGDPQWPALVLAGDHAAAIWNERASSYEGVAVARYNFTTDTWTEPFDVFSDNSPAFTPFKDIAIDLDGDVTAIIRQVDSGEQQLWARPYDAAGDAWGTSVEATSGDYQQLNGWAIQYDRTNGEPMLVFAAPVSAKASLFYTRRGAGGWSIDAEAEQNDVDNVHEFDFVANDMGQGLIVYSMEVGASDTPTYFVLPYENGDFRRDGSNALDPFSTTTMGLFGDPVADLNNNGEGLLFIDDSFATDRKLYTVAIDLDADTMGPQVLLHDTESPNSIGISDAAISESGGAVVAWGQTMTPGGSRFPWGSLYNGSWSTPASLGSQSVGNGVRAAIDSSGVATVVWAAGSPGVFATRNTGPGGAFIEAQEVTGQVQASGNIELVAHDSGDFLAVWQESGTIQAARCSSSD